jgi:hypothetical protein
MLPDGAALSIWCAAGAIGRPRVHGGNGLTQQIGGGCSKKCLTVRIHGVLLEISVQAKTITRPSRNRYRP